MKLLIQPGDEIGPLVEGIERAKKSVEIVIFRFDRPEVERALKAAVKRGVFVHALIAYTNRGGERNLRKLEMRMLEAGINVARTADDLSRYHDKFLIIDRRTLYLLSFNYTYLDVEHSRSFGIVTKNRELVQEAIHLFEADTQRKPYSPGLPKTFLVSPVNARKGLAAFVKGARTQLLIYDPKITDSQMIQILQDRVKAGVEVKIIGKLSKRSGNLAAKRLAKFRLHTRTLIRDRHQAFVGSQSLKKSELDERREVGIIIHDRKVVNGLISVFESDWTSIEVAEGKAVVVGKDTAPLTKVVKKAVKTIAKELPLAPLVKEAVKEAVENKQDARINKQEVHESVRDAVKEAIKEAVKETLGGKR